MKQKSNTKARSNFKVDWSFKLEFEKALNKNLQDKIQIRIYSLKKFKNLNVNIYISHSNLKESYYRISYLKTRTEDLD